MNVLMLRALIAMLFGRPEGAAQFHAVSMLHENTVADHAEQERTRRPEYAEPPPVVNPGPDIFSDDCKPPEVVRRWTQR